MPQELVDRKTPATKEQVITALWSAWMRYFGQAPKRESIWVLAAQWALETGWGRSMHNYNLGNVKSREGDGFDYQFYACNEILPKAEATKLHEADPEHAKILTTRSDGTCIIWFYPNHPGCRFRAFNTLIEGATDYIAILAKRFDKAWPAVSAGDPAQFCHLLKQQDYYTADEAGYTKTLVSVYTSISKMAFDYDTLPLLTEAEKTAIGNNAAASLDGLARDIIEDADTEPRD